MKETIESKEQIKRLVDEFYKKVIADDTIGYIFNDVTHISWEQHLPVMYRFWETVLLGEASYKGNPMTAHINLHKKSPLTQAHFERWKSLFFETIDTYFEGEKVTEAKNRVVAMEYLMMLKINASSNKDFIQ